MYVIMILDIEVNDLILLGSLLLYVDVVFVGEDGKRIVDGSKGEIVVVGGVVRGYVNEDD